MENNGYVKNLTQYVNPLFIHLSKNILHVSTYETLKPVEYFCKSLI